MPEHLGLDLWKCVPGNSREIIGIDPGKIENIVALLRDLVRLRNFEVTDSGNVPKSLDEV